MKKLLIILMVVAVASFLFVGCLVTPELNQAPVITPIPDATVTAGDAFTYAVVATDPDVGDVLTYSLTVAPETPAMVIDAATGAITWPIATEGTFGVIVVVTDEGGLSDFEGFTITVSAVEPEPEPEPELVLVGIEVDPDTMDLFVGEEEYITSVTATYEIRGYDVDVDFVNCLFLTGNSKVATVDEFGLVTAVKVGTTNILVSYEDKIDTLRVTVREPKSMEIIADDLLTFTAATPGGFTASLVANDDVGKLALAYFTLPTGTTLEYDDVFFGWNNVPVDAITGEHVFGGSGFLLEDIEINFKATFTCVAGTYPTLVEVWEVAAGPTKVGLLGYKVITAIVIP